MSFAPLKFADVISPTNVPLNQQDQLLPVIFFLPGLTRAYT